MKITKRSPLTGQENTMDLDITQADIDNWKQKRLLIQQAFPHLNKTEREFLKTGYTQADWDVMFPPGSDDSYTQEES